MSILPERKPEVPIPAPALLDERAALTSYLESLFAPAPMYYPVPVSPPSREGVVPREPRECAQRPPAEQVVEIISPPPTIVAAPPVAEEAVVVPVMAVAIPTPVVTAEPAVTIATTTAPAPGEIPEWGKQPFACLLLRVNGLNLALPLVKLNRILPWTDPGVLPGYAPWMLGILRHLDQNVRVIDTAALVMPEVKKTTPAAATASEDTRRIVLIDDGRWGLVCDGVSEVITLDPTKIRWRQADASREGGGTTSGTKEVERRQEQPPRATSGTKAEGKRPWMAGMVTEQLCALLDVERLAALLTAGCADLSDEAAPAAVSHKK